MAATGLSISGEREHGQDVRSANVTAVLAVANTLRTSLGPQGLDKMLVDQIGEVTISNDGATILAQLDVEHPAAKVLVELSNLQDQEVGDGTTSVVLLAAELLSRGNDLVKNHVHPTAIMNGYRLALRESVNYIQKNLMLKLDQLPKETLFNLASTSLSSKFVGADEMFAKMVVQAIESVKVPGPAGKAKYPVAQVNILKSHGRSITESTLIPNGYAIPLGRAGQGMVTRVQNAKIALLDFDLKKFRLGMNVEIKVEDPKEIERIRQKEMDITRDRINCLLKAGANVFLTTKGMDDLSIKYVVEAGGLGVRRVDKKDIRRIAKATGGQVLLTLGQLDGEEKVEPSVLGQADEVYEQPVGDNDHIFITGCKASRATTILLRGSTEYQLEEMERSVHDSLCAVSKALEFNACVPGGAAVETALNIYVEDFARSLGSREQLAVAEFAEAMLVIPKTLANNAALDAVDLTSRLRVHHNAAQTPQANEKEKEYKWYGLDLTKGKVRNSLTAGCLEPAVGKLKALKFATEAAISILRIDDLIKLQPPPEEQR
jgi:T-complex protein 1 subunit alpha